MISYKYVVLGIIFLMLMPCKIIFSQDTEISQDTGISWGLETDTVVQSETDAVVQSETDIKYDSVLAKATSSLTALAFRESIDFYKEASILKPGETYPYKMIRYVKDLEIRQKRSDELKRKAQIRDGLIKANQAIVDKSWNIAKSLFNEILTLHPEQKDEDYAESKIEAIDLELQRIASRTPVKVEPPPAVVPPRNRREARAQRKLAERNAIIASASNRAKAQKQLEAIKAAPLGSDKNVNKSIAASPKQVLQPSTKGSLPDTIASAMPLTKNISESPEELRFLDIITGAIPPTKEISKPPVEASLSDTTVAVDTPLAKKISQTPTEALLPDTFFLPKEISQPPTGASLQNTKVAVDTPVAKEISQPPTEASLPDTKAAVDRPVAKEISQPLTEASLPNAKVAVDRRPVAKEILQPPTEASLPDTKVAVDKPSTKEILQKSTGASLPDTKVAVDKPSTKEILQKPTGALLPDRKVAVSTPSTTDPLTAEPPFAEKKADSLMLPTEKTEEKPTGVPVLNLADSSNYVKMVCQDISFIGTNAYIKILVQNNSGSTRFLTDTLKVSIKKKNGIEKKLDQRFISNFPVVMPQKELVLVYFADAVAVDPDDIFILQMEDKLKQTKLMIQVPWSLYKEHKSF